MLPFCLKYSHYSPLFGVGTRYCAAALSIAPVVQGLRLQKSRKNSFRVKRSASCVTGRKTSSKNATNMHSAPVSHQFVPVPNEEELQPSSDPALALRIVSYNILAQAYVKSSMFPHSPAASLRWKNRSQALAKELTSLDADVLCLQELDEFESFYEPLMRKHGYSSIYRKRPGRKKDGSGIFFRTSRFELMARQDIDYNDLVPRESEKPRPAVPAGRPLLGAQTGELLTSLTFSKEHASWTYFSASEGSGGDLKLESAAEARVSAIRLPGSTAMGSWEVQGASPLGGKEGGAAEGGGVGLPRSQSASKASKGGERGDPNDPTVRMKRDCVGVMAALRPREQPGGIFIVACTHLYWDPNWADVKLAQAKHLLACLDGLQMRLEAAHKATIPILLCGDFNSQPGDPVYTYLTSGEARTLPLQAGGRTGAAAPTAIDQSENGQNGSQHSSPPSKKRAVERLLDDCNFRELCEEEGNLQAPVALRSVYNIGGPEPPFTTFTPGFTGTLDYIFFSSESMVAVRRRLAVPGPQADTLLGGLPNVSHPSDHLPVGADLELRWPENI